MDASSHIEFMRNNSKKCQFRSVKRAVAERLNEDTASLSRKQDKLKSLLAAEECVLNEEIILIQERMKETEIETKKINAYKAECDAERRRRSEALEKIKALHRDNSEDLRIQESIQKHIEAVAGIKYQIEEKHKNYLREKELNAVWSEIMDQYYKMEQQSEEAREQKQKTLNELYKSILHEQVAEKNEIKMKELKQALEETEKIKKSVIEFKREQEKELQQQISQKRDLAKNKYEELAEFRAQREKQKIKEKEFANFYVNNQVAGDDGKKSEIFRKKFASKLELDLHRAEVKRIKDEIKKIEILEQEMLEKELCLIERKHQEEAIKESIKRVKIEQEMMRMRMFQLSEKRAEYD